jgi:septation ring formation regulator EzrA
MKKVRKFNTNKEPTLTSVMGAVQDLTEVMQIGFAKVEGRFEHLEQRMDSTDIGFSSMNERMDGIDARLGDVQRKLTKVENKVEDIQDDLTSALHATGNDGSAILNHEHRIVHLEKLGGIKSVPAKHLAGL